jgi:hypothetical protein
MKSIWERAKRPVVERPASHNDLGETEEGGYKQSGRRLANCQQFIGRRASIVPSSGFDITSEKRYELREYQS